VVKSTDLPELTNDLIELEPDDLNNLFRTVAA
jgi:hypothetical protein